MANLDTTFITHVPGYDFHYALSGNPDQSPILVCLMGYKNTEFSRNTLSFYMFNVTNFEV